MKPIPCLVASLVVLAADLALQAQQKKPPKEFTNTIGMKFVWIPPGSFLMGSPKDEDGNRKDETQHQVTLTKGFYLGAYTVTQEQWQAVMGNNPSYFQDEEKLPVDNVSWDDCQVFLEKLRKKEGRLYRLPNEAEWEFACRAGSKAAYCYGDDLNVLDQYAWHAWNSGDTTHPVGQKKPNAWGLFDMHGNLWQWCADFYEDYPQHDIIDPPNRFLEPSHIAGLIKKLSSPTFAERQAATKALKVIGPPVLAPLRVVTKVAPDLETQRRAEQLVAAISSEGKPFALRGGSFSVLPWTVRSAYRNYNEPSASNPNYGVRVAMTFSAE